MNGKSAAKAADFFIPKMAQACLQAILGNKKSQQTGGLAGTFHSQNGANREGRSQSLNSISASLLASYFGNKKSQQTGGLEETFHSQNGANREDRRQSLNLIGASLLAIPLYLIKQTQNSSHLKPLPRYAFKLQVYRLLQHCSPGSKCCLCKGRVHLLANNAQKILSFRHFHKIQWALMK